MDWLKRAAMLSVVLGLSLGALTLGGCRAEGEIDADDDHDAHGIEHRDDADLEVRGDVEVDE